MTMRIGILTLTLLNNYGGILQAYALQTVLERMGHEVKVINTKPLERQDIFPGRQEKFRSYIRRFIHSVRNGGNKMEKPMGKNQYIMTLRYVLNFIEKYIQSYYVKSVDEIRREDFDAIVVGSDQIWNPRFSTDLRKSKDNLSFEFLDFARNWDIKRYAYAASFGVDEWLYPDEYTKINATLAKKFLAISVREDSGVELCKKYLGVNAVHLIDPTMLLAPADYSKLVEAANIPACEGDLFCYILDSREDKTALIERIAKERDMHPFYVKSKSYVESRNIVERSIPPVEKWLRAFMDAKFVVTDSFHGMAFSINFGKPFVAIGNQGRGLARMSSIARMFGIEDHLLIDTADYDPDKSYDVAPETRNILEEQRQRSRDFLSQIK